MRLKAVDYIDAVSEGHYATYPFEQISTQRHQHDFYEIFLIADGRISHHINSELIVLGAGSLVLIRPDDTHFYSRHDDENCQLVNLAFLANTFDDLSAYLGLQSHRDKLLSAPMPPSVQLTSVENTRLISQLGEWGRTLYRDRDRARLELRALLAGIMMDYFVTRAEDYSGDVPEWLVGLCQKMRQHTHLIEGRPALMRLANRTPEYVGRAFRDYLDTTPSEFINDLRLDYASELLLYSDDPVTDICYAVGFGNLSHFYHRFKARYDCPPLVFRKSNRRTLIP